MNPAIQRADPFIRAFAPVPCAPALSHTRRAPRQARRVLSMTTLFRALMLPRPWRRFIPLMALLWLTLVCDEDAREALNRGQCHPPDHSALGFA